MTLTWRPISGDWQVFGTTIIQKDENAHPAIIVATGTEAAQEFTCEAKRISGDDGFSVVAAFLHPDQAAWWDIGGYGGAKSIAEFSLPGVGVFMLPQTDRPFHIENNRWYRIQLKRSGRHVVGLVDGIQLIDFAIPDQVSPNSTLGLRTWSSRFEFRNVFIQ